MLSLLLNVPYSCATYGPFIRSMASISRSSLWWCFGCILSLWYTLMTTLPPDLLSTALYTAATLGWGSRGGP